MPTISIRGNEMPASPIRKLAPLADAAKQRGVHVFHLNIGQPDLPTPQAAIDAIRNIDRKVLEYSPSAGYRSYREKLVGYYAKFNINLTADDIIITSGGSEAVLFSFLSCLNPGDEIIVPEPAYANYMAFAISAGAKIRTIATTIEEGFSLPKVEKFEELINERTKAILICNPNNPTGYLYTRREMNQIRDLVKKYDLFLFSDEVYREFIYTGSPKVKSLPLVWFVPIPALRLMVGRYPALAISIPSSEASTLSLLASISGRRVSALIYTSFLVGNGNSTFSSDRAGR